LSELASKPVKLKVSKCFPVCPRKRISVPRVNEPRLRRTPAADSWRMPPWRPLGSQHTRGVGVRSSWCPKARRPHPRRADWRCVGLEDAADRCAKPGLWRSILDFGGALCSHGWIGYSDFYSACYGRIQIKPTVVDRLSYLCDLEPVEAARS
jgi:hypothetical protein